MLVLGNFAAATLTAAITDTDVVIPIGDTSDFPNVDLAADYFYLVLTDEIESVFEIIRIIGSDATNLITELQYRGSEDTTPATWPISSKAELRPTAASIIEAPIGRHALLAGSATQDFNVGDNAGSSPNFAIRFIQVVRNFGDQIIAGVKTFSGGITLDNNVKNIFKNLVGNINGLGSKQIFTDAQNIFRIQRHDGANWHNAILINEDGRTAIYGVDNASTAIFDVEGTLLTSDLTVITREKGDARYTQQAQVDQSIATHNALATAHPALARVGGDAAQTFAVQLSTVPTNAASVQHTNDLISIHNALATAHSDQFGPIGITLGQHNTRITTAQSTADSKTTPAEVTAQIATHNTAGDAHNARFDTKLNTGLAVLLAGAQTVAGIKSFTSGSIFSANLVIAPNPGDGLTSPSVLDIFTSGIDNTTIVQKRNAAGDTWLPMLVFNGDDGTFSGGYINQSVPILQDNDLGFYFRNAAGTSQDIGAKRIVNDAFDVLTIQHHNGTVFQNAITVGSGGLTSFFGINGQLAGIVDNAGDGASNAQTLITRQKGDFRYARWHTTEAAAAAQTDGLIHFADEGS